MKIHELITETAPLAELCERLAKSDFVCVDTEFMRENTYWPELCLVQIGNEEEAAAIDPLADGIDLTPLWDLLCENEDILKVFHAGGQDVEIVYNFTGKTPQPIFDTQIAMMAISQSEQIGYANLVESWLGLTIDKGARFTDWSRRPLTDRQIEYAIGDVTHLAKIFPRILKKLIKTGRGAWLDAEMEKLADPQNYANDADLAWKRIRSSGRNPAVLGRLKALAAWRESEAQHKNIPRGQRPNMYDNSIFVPTAVRWPGHIAPGTQLDLPVANLDWYPTLLALTGIAPPKGETIRGRNISGALLGNKADWPNVCYGEYSTLHQSKTHMRMIRTANWKLVRDFRNPERDELFDLKNDPAESQNVIKARQNVTVVKELHGMILARMREVKDPVLTRLQPKTEK